MPANSSLGDSKEKVYQKCVLFKNIGYHYSLKIIKKHKVNYESTRKEINIS